MAPQWGRDAARPSVDPIFAGVADDEQDNEFFNCDVAPVTAIGYTQAVVRLPRSDGHLP